jgi:hypothetical protein
MNKKIIIVVLILILIAAGAYLLMKKTPQAPVNHAPVTIQNKPANSKSQTMQGTIKSLLTAGKSQKCTYSSQLESSSVEGIVYVTNGKMKGDFTTTSKENKVTGHMIVDGGYSYIWTDLTSKGIKMAIDLQQQPSSASANSQAPDINQSFSYTCQGWTPDNTVFAPPSNVSFTTFTLPSSGAMPSGIQVPSAACSACDSIPAGAGRDTCRTQLHCQ